MAARNVDGPDAALSSTPDAAKWIGLEPKLFLKAAWDTDWCRPVKVGRRTFWAWMDLVALHHSLSCKAKNAGPRPAKPKKNELPGDALEIPGDALEIPGEKRGRRGANPGSGQG